MPFDTLQKVAFALLFLAPGAIATWVRAQFLTGRVPPPSSAALTLLILSTLYLALVLPIAAPLLAPFGQSTVVYFWWYYAGWFGIVFVGPVLFGMLLGWIARKRPHEKLLARFGINPVHATPTAWDYAFGLGREAWILVTLKDGTRFAGWYSASSFSSSDPNERDVYIDPAYALGANDEWIPRPGASLLIGAGEVQTINFWDPNRSTTNERTEGTTPAATNGNARLPAEADRGSGRVPANDGGEATAEPPEPGIRRKEERLRMFRRMRNGA